MLLNQHLSADREADLAATSLETPPPASSISEAFSRRNALAEEFLFLADEVTRRVVPRCFASMRDDIRQEAACALLEFAARYDPSRGVPFQWAAMAHMRFRALSYLRTQGAPIPAERLGQTLHALRRAIRNTDRAPDDWSDHELSARAGLPLRTVRNARPWLGSEIRLDALQEDESDNRREALAWSALEQEQTPTAFDDHDQLQILISQLDFRDRHLLTRVFGLDGEVPVSVSQAVIPLGISPQRGRIRLQRALKILRSSWRE